MRRKRRYVHFDELTGASLNRSNAGGNGTQEKGKKKKGFMDKLKESLDGLSNRDINAYEELMYGLLLSGLAMQMTGHSRPASGAEHHMAHFWEMAVINDEIDAYHGEKVGVGLIQVSDIYHEAVKYLKEGNFKVKDHVDIENRPDRKDIYQ